MEADEEGPSLYPMHRCKIINLVRHAEGTHNQAAAHDKKAYNSPQFFDAPITELGWQQARQLQGHALRARVFPQIVVTSPLTRCLQTAVASFGGGSMAPNEPTCNALMAEGVALTHPAISSRESPPFICVEWCREHMGIHPCDKRRPTSVLRRQYPAVDFSELASESDVMWRPNYRESHEELYQRGKVFVQWLLWRDERRIAVVTHSSFIWHMMRLFGADCSPVVRKEMQDGFTNCEMRNLTLVDRKAVAPPRCTYSDFAGGSVRYVADSD